MSLFRIDCGWPPGAHARRGLTMIELLVVIAIITLMLAVLLPAVQKVREVAARKACANQLRQVGLGFHMHHDRLGRFPYGGMHVPDGWTADLTATTPKVREATWSWAYHLLPYIEQGHLYDEPDPAVVRATPVKLYYCPTRRPAQLYNGLAKIDYAGNAGTVFNGTNGVVVKTPYGVVRMRDITDGLSSTVLVGEKRMNKAMFGHSRDDDEAYCTPGWNGDYEVYREADPPAPDVRVPGHWGAHSMFGSAHPGGFGVVFCDGSVRFIRYSVSAGTWAKACVRNDNQTYDNAEL